ncbi:MAG: TIM barrel protein [Fimbriimonadaceae bacterium]|nr:TIM barrel protein [Fimbriimonadaceae bacterium]
MQLGLVTYNLAKDWDLATLLTNCAATGFAGVELRTSHAHGVEPGLSAAARRAVRDRFEASGVVLWALGSVCEFDHPEAAVVRANIATAAEYLQLAAEVGAVGVKVRPNHLHDGLDPADTCRQIGLALQEVGQAAEDLGVLVFLEVHGRGTSDPHWIREILDVCEHPSVGACWNSNPTPPEVVDGSIGSSFRLLADDIISCHITELWRPDYPYRELFARLSAVGYDGFTLAEIPESPEPLRLMRYYRALWEALQPAA